MDELIRMTACRAVDLLRTGELSPLDLIDAAERRIAETNPDLNAMPTLCLDRARDRAKAACAKNAGFGAPLHGLPLAIKDLMDVAGVRTTYGSVAFKDHISDKSDMLVTRIEDRGGLVVGKSNTPEFGAGSTTFNEVLGKTCNPWDLSLTCGGSSGGAAAALASGQVWLATGSDLGGSLRIPASFCGIVGLRPSPGCVGSGPNEIVFDDLSVEGPMGRTVADAALLLDAMAGDFPEDPISRPSIGKTYRSAAENARLPSRVGYADTLGVAPVDSNVSTATRKAVERLAGAGLEVEDACPDFSGAAAVFGTLRALSFLVRLGPVVKRYGDLIRPDIIWNVEEGSHLSAEAIAEATRVRSLLFHRVMEFLDRYDLLITPTVVAPPFDVNSRYLAGIADHRFENYFAWLAQTYSTSLVACPTISIPCGFTSDRRPVGIQILGKPHSEAKLLAYAAWMEGVFDLARLVPIDPQNKKRIKRM